MVTSGYLVGAVDFAMGCFFKDFSIRPTKLARCSAGNEKSTDPKKNSPTGAFLYSGTKAWVHSMSHSPPISQQDRFRQLTGPGSWMAGTGLVSPARFPGSAAGTSLGPAQHRGLRRGRHARHRLRGVCGGLLRDVAPGEPPLRRREVCEPGAAWVLGKP